MSKFSRRQSKRHSQSRRMLRAEELEDRRVLATFTVTDLADAGPGTLRRAVQQANLSPGEDNVVFSSAVAGGTISLQSELLIEESLNLDAASIDGITLDLTSADATPGVADGGGIRAMYIPASSLVGALSLNQFTIVGGDLAGWGGAIRGVAEQVTLRDSVFTGNSARSGGALHLTARDFSVTGSTISGNVAFFDPTTGSNFANGEAGGAKLSSFFESSSSFDFRDNVVSDNSASTDTATYGQGGGLLLGWNDGTNVDFSDNLIAGNQAVTGGGLAFFVHEYVGVPSGGGFTMSGNVVRDNMATGSGGGVFAGGSNYLTAGDPVLSGTFRDNQAAGAGGGVFMSGSMTLANSVVSGNTAGGLGGGVFAGANINGKLKIQDSYIHGNSADQGGGITVDTVLSYVVEIDRVTISDNDAIRDGGGVLLRATANLAHVTVSGNRAGGDGGGIFNEVQYTNPYFTAVDFVTISGNVADSDGDGSGTGGGWFDRHVGSNMLPAAITNSIFANNQVGSVDQDIDSQTGTGTPEFNYSLVEHPGSTAIAGVGNILGSDPQLEPLAMNGGLTPTHAIPLTSPVVDQGDPSFADTVATDQRSTGFVRLSDADGDGTATVDMGAYEIQGGNPMNQIPIANAGADDTTPEYVDLILDGSGSSDPDNNPSALTYSWAIVSGPGTATFGSPSNVMTTFNADLDGTYEVELTVFDGLDSATDTVTISVTQNMAPIADASLSDFAGTVDLPVILDASASSDPEDEPLTYIWSVLSSPAGSSPNILNPTAEITGFFTDVAGDYTFQLTVSDGHQSTQGNAASSVDFMVSIVAAPMGDFNDDGAYDCLDVDALVAEISGGGGDVAYDLTADGQVDMMDLDVWLAEAGAANLASGNAYIHGDANLDGTVDVSDFNIWNTHKFSNTPAWCSGDFTADGSVDVSDFNVWNTHKFSSALDGFAIVVESDDSDVESKAARRVIDLVFQSF